MDYQTLLYNPIYMFQGVPVTITLADGATVFEGLTALDKTGGIDTGEPVEVQTILPAAVLRMKEILDAGINKDELPGGSITMSGYSWRIDSTLAKPSPAGENDGEIQLMLSAQEVASSE